jgi:hypothetical protein
MGLPWFELPRLFGDLAWRASLQSREFATTRVTAPTGIPNSHAPSGRHTADGMTMICCALPLGAMENGWLREGPI